jgi:DNA adenine methylase
MSQEKLFESETSHKLVNVASVPQRSPFRYPGGKTWLVPWIRKWIQALPFRPRNFVEPFAGGAIVGLTVAFERLAQKVVLIELDDDVASVWRTILGNDADWLAKAIMRFELTPESAYKVVSTQPRSDRLHAFQTLLRNRVNHGGILAPGSGVLKHGENGKGIKSRWYPETLARRIKEIGALKKEVTIRFIHGDGIEIMRRHDDVRTLFFIDPPYTAGGKKAGNRLYVHSQIDHRDLFGTVKKLQGDFLMTYDTADEVMEMACEHGFDMEQIPMTNTHHAEMKELLIGRDLSWARGIDTR